MVRPGESPHILVGIYWVVEGIVIGDAVPLEEAEPYGEALQHGGHYDYWCTLRPKTDAERKLKSGPYDYWPRGRLVFFPKRSTVRLYADPCLDNDDLNEVLDFFGHSGYRIEIEGDDHYRCSGCNPQFMELPSSILSLPR
jgi:hypothetical protein